jgi:hypothetical protein
VINHLKRGLKHWNCGHFASVTSFIFQGDVGVTYASCRSEATVWIALNHNSESVRSFPAQIRADPKLTFVRSLLSTLAPNPSVLVGPKSYVNDVNQLGQTRIVYHELLTFSRE